MRYTNFDAEFPKRCLELLGSPYARTGRECTKLLAIGGTLLSATADRQFAFDTHAHIATGGRSMNKEVAKFLKVPLLQALPGLREELKREHMKEDRMPSHRSKPPSDWDPCYFELAGVRAGDPNLRRSILDDRKPLDGARWAGDEVITIKHFLQASRNALSHGNVWLFARSDFEDARGERRSSDSAITGFALAQTNPSIDDRRKARPDTPYIVRGFLVSPFDLRAVWEAWARLLMRVGATRAEGGTCLAEGLEP